MSMPPPPPGPGYGYGSPYGSPYGGYEHPQGTTILVLGILGLVVCQLLGPVAWVMGNNAMAEIDRNPMAYTNRSTVQAGRICGIIATALTALFILFSVLAFAGAFAASA